MLCGRLCAGGDDVGCSDGSTKASTQDGGAASTQAATANAPSGTVTLPPRFPERPFVRLKFDQLTVETD